MNSQQSVTRAPLQNSTDERIMKGQYSLPPSRFVDVRVGRQLLFQFDPVRGLIRIRKAGGQHVIDLSEHA